MQSSIEVIESNPVENHYQQVTGKISFVYSVALANRMRESIQKALQIEFLSFSVSENRVLFRIKSTDQDNLNNYLLKKKSLGGNPITMYVFKES